MKILCVEDGSVDTDKIDTEGLRDGTVLVYRQGATPPFVLNLDDLDQLAIYKRALGLACDSIRDMYCSDHCLCTRDERCKGKCIYKKYYNEKKFIDQAKKELEEQDVKD